MIYVIIPVYNTEPYLEECLNSVFEQIAEKRIICVDDGSTDKSLDILKRFQPFHSELTVLSIENNGPSHARNFALDYIFETCDVKKDDYIAFVDSDDFIAPDYFETLLRTMTRDHSDIVCCNFQFYSCGESRPFSQKPIAGVRSRLEATEELLLDHTIQSHSHCKLYRADLWREVRFPEDIVAMEDQGTVFKAFCKSHRVTAIDYDGYFYRQRSDSICSAKITNKRVLDSMNGYMIPCCYDFAEFSSAEAMELRRTATDSFALVFLMMIPRFDWSKASLSEKSEMKEILGAQKKLHAVLRLKPRNKKEWIKKWSFLLLRPLYKALYNLNL